MNLENFTQKNLTLFENLSFSTKTEDNSYISKLECLYKYENKVKKSDTNPNIKMFLTNEIFCGYGFYGEKSENHIDDEMNFIPKGKYLFLQGIGSKEDFEIIEKAAEALFLEALWQEIDLKDEVFVRFLQEDKKTVFQIFREIR